MSAVHTLPHWDMTVVYPGLESQEFAQGFARGIQDINELAHLFDTYHIMEQTSTSVNNETIKAFEAVVERYNAVLDTTRTLSAYIMCFVTTKTSDNLAQARMSELQQATIILSQLDTRFAAWIGSLDIEALIDRSALARDHAFMLRKAKLRAEHLMSPPEEALFSELNVSGGTAWSKLHSDVTSQLIVPLELDGQIQELPMSMVRNLAYEADRDLRRRAYEVELAGWKRVAVPLAAALNSIKGEVNALVKRRNWTSPL